MCVVCVMFLHGRCGAHVWHGVGMRMDCVWHSVVNAGCGHVARTVHVWSLCCMHGMRSVYVGYMYGICNAGCFVSVRYVHGRCMVCAWSAYCLSCGVYMVCGMCYVVRVLCGVYVVWEIYHHRTVVHI